MDFNRILEGIKTLGKGAVTGGAMAMNLIAPKVGDPQEALYQSNQVPQVPQKAVNASVLNNPGLQVQPKLDNSLGAILKRAFTMPTAPSPTPTAMPSPTAMPTPTASVPSSWSNIPQPAVPTPSPKPNATVDGFSGINIPGGVPNDFAGIMLQAAQDNGINPALLAALFYQEGKFNPKAFNPQNGSEDRGMAQISKKWHPEVTDAQAYDPNFAIPFAAKKLSSDIKSFDDISRGIAAYNVGRGGASVNGPEKFGGGPKGQQYIDLISQYLTPEAIQALGIKQNWKY